LVGNANVCPLPPDRTFSNIGFSTIGLDGVVKAGVRRLVVGGRTVGFDPSKGIVGSQVHADGHVGLVLLHRLGNVVGVDKDEVDAEVESPK